MSIISPNLYNSRTFTVPVPPAFRIEMPLQVVNRNSWDFRKSPKIPDDTDDEAMTRMAVSER
jgi:hypothetical protein